MTPFALIKHNPGAATGGNSGDQTTEQPLPARFFNLSGTLLGEAFVHYDDCQRPMAGRNEGQIRSNQFALEQGYYMMSPTPDRIVPIRVHSVIYSPGGSVSSLFRAVEAIG